MARRTERRPRGPSRGQLSRRQREERQRWLIFTGVGAALVLVIGVLAFGYYQENFVKPFRPVAKVRGQSITVQDYQDRLGYQRFWLNLRRAELLRARTQLATEGEEAAQLSQWIRERLEELDGQEANLPFQLVDTMIDDLLILQAAEREGVPRATAEEIEEELQTLFRGEMPQPGQETTTITATIPITPTPTLAPRSEEEIRQMMADFLRSFQRETGLGEEYLRARLGEEILRRRMRERLAATVEQVAEQVHVCHILLESEEEAKQALARLQAGEDFASLAQELSRDTVSGEQGGDLGWFPRGLMEPSFEEAAFSLEAGELSQVVQTPYGYHILQMLGREERPLEEAVLATLREAAFYQWSQEEREAAQIEWFPLPELPTPRPRV